jgi:hypothetical protein
MNKKRLPLSLMLLKCILIIKVLDSKVWSSSSTSILTVFWAINIFYFGLKYYLLTQKFIIYSNFYILYVQYQILFNETVHEFNGLDEICFSGLVS